MHLRTLFLKCRNDFELFSRYFLRITTKSGRLVPFVFNRTQREVYRVVKSQMDAGRPVRLVVLKARQCGMSTFCQAFVFWRVVTSRNTKAICIAHDQESAENLFGISRLFYDSLPVPGPKRKYSSKKELVFDDPENPGRGLLSSIVVKAAGSRASGRSYTTHVLHCSEVAYWPHPEVFAALLPSVPMLPNTAVFLESTANGVDNEFYRYWVDAVEGRSIFEPVFVPWYWVEDYSVSDPEMVKQLMKEPLDEYEEWLVREKGVGFSQIAWRRMKVVEIGEIQFQIEYPSTPEEAFTVTGLPVFDLNDLRACYEPMDPVSRGDVVRGASGPQVVLGENGRLVIYHPPDPSYTKYVIGADVAMGVEGGDYSAAVVVRWDAGLGKFVECAVWHGHIDPVSYASVLEGLARYYNGALVTIEVTNIGLLTQAELERRYHRLYRWRILDTVAAKPTTKRGWWTSRTTKGVFIGFLQSCVKNRALLIHDPRTYGEMEHYQYGSTPDEYEAAPGYHDDLVVALGIAVISHRQEFQFEQVETMSREEPKAAPLEPVLREEDYAWYYEDF